MKVPLQEIIYWILLPLLNFLFWYYFGHMSVLTTPCEQQIYPNSLKQEKQLLAESLEELKKDCEKQKELKRLERTESGKSLFCSKSNDPTNKRKVSITLEETVEFEKYRKAKLASMTDDISIHIYSNSMTAVAILNTEEVSDSRSCQSLDHHMIAHYPTTCLAIVYSQSVSTTENLVRVDQDIDIYGLSISNPDPSQVDKYSQPFPLNQYNKDHYYPSGFFRKVPKERGRERTKDKLGTFLQNFQEINQQFLDKVLSHNLQKGTDLVAMVVNEGELDLFLNFACSCYYHDISLNNILVFAGNQEMIPMVEATGAMAIFHPGYASVSKRASVEYLDRVFVDMMWFKAFSVFLVVRNGYNVLFQDVDLVWFREPMEYFHNYTKYTDPNTVAFFSDDGQRSRRYTPVFANSGFYYLLSNSRSIYFTWSIMIAMDAIQVLGSHQNVFTTRLLEGLAINFGLIKLLSLEEFPTGIMYHHNRDYMKKIRNNQVHPYHFHMCWTQGKPDKLIYLRKAKMWYLTEECSPQETLIAGAALSATEIEELSPEQVEKVSKPGIVYAQAKPYFNEQRQTQWKRLSQQCCHRMPGAP